MKEGIRVICHCKQNDKQFYDAWNKRCSVGLWHAIGLLSVEHSLFPLFTSIRFVIVRMPHMVRNDVDVDAATTNNNTNKNNHNYPGKKKQVEEKEAECWSHKSSNVLHHHR